MTIRIEERFMVNAPVERVWAFLVDPRRVAACVPGARLTEVVDERTFHGDVTVKVGAVTVTYRSRVHVAELDAAAHRVKMTGEGRESAGSGAARMSMQSHVTAAPGGETEVAVEADLDVVGRIVQLGRGIIEQVAHQLFAQFASCMRAKLEAETGATAGSGQSTAHATAEAAQGPPLRTLPLLMRALWAWLLLLFRRAPRRPR